MKLKSTVAGTATLVLALSLALSGCTGGAEPGGSGSASPGATEPVTLTVGLFGNIGYEGDVNKQNNMFRLYEQSHPGVTIKENNLGEGGDALTATLNAIGAGGVGLPDVQLIEEGWRVQMMGLSDSFVDLNNFGFADFKDRWLPWKQQLGVDPNGRQILAGVDIGPQGMCFDLTQVKAAGIATNRDEFAAALGGDGATWDQFWTVGEQYTKKTGKPWVGVPSFVWNSFVNQQPEGYYKSDGTLSVLDNQTLKGFLAKIIDEQKAGVVGNIDGWAWTNDSFHGNFAAHVCPTWMLGSIQDAVKSGSDTWDFADVFPGGDTNWGGSFLAVPTVSKHQAAAAALIDWLTQPAQQAMAFQNAGSYPSSPEAQALPAVTDFTNATFNNAPVGKIASDRAKGVVAQFKGEKDSVIQDTVFGGVIQELNAGKISSIDQAWDRVKALLDENDVK